jgi:hypothetical protein
VPSERPNPQDFSTLTRRQFLHASGTVAAVGVASANALPVTPSLLSGGVLGANERIGIGLIGCGGRGTSLAGALLNV